MDFMNGTDNAGLVFNLNDVEDDKGFELLPKGEYPAIVDEIDFTESKSGNPMVKIVYLISEGEYEGRKLFDFWVLAGNGAEFGLQKLKKFIARCVPTANMSAFDVQSFCDNGEAIGVECTLKVSIQTQKKGEYKGEKRNNIQDILAPQTNSFM